jgi:exosortase A
MMQPPEGAQLNHLESVESRARSFGWLPRLLPLALATAVFFIYWPTATTLMKSWGDEAGTTYTHGYLIVALCAWLLVRDRAPLLLFESGRRYLPFACLALTSFLWLVAVLAGIQLIHQVLLPVLMWLALWSFFGPSAAMRAWFPIAYLYFAIPVWDEINFILQGATVVAVDVMLQITGIAAYVEANMVHIGPGSFEIAGGCSGLHFFIVALAIGALYGEINRDTFKVRAQLLLLAVVIGVVTNWLRVYIIIVAGYLTDMQHYLVRVEHYTFGWVVFAFTMIVYFLVARRFPAAAEAAGSRASPVTANGRPRVANVLAVVLFLSLGPVWYVAASAHQPIAAWSLPEMMGQWSRSESIDESQWSARFVGADDLQRAAYSSGTARLEVLVVRYAYQQQGKELIGYENSLFGEHSVVSSGLDTETASSPVLEGIAASRPDTRWIYQYVYEVGSARATRSIAVQLKYAMSSLDAAPPTSRLIALRSRCHTDCNDERATLRSFWREMDASQAFAQELKKRRDL